MRNFRSFALAIAVIVAFAGVAMAADVVWRTLTIRGSSDARIEVPDFMKEYAAEKPAKGDQAKVLFVASGIDSDGGVLSCALSRWHYAHDKRHLTAVQSQALTASQLTNDPGIACKMLSPVPDGKYEQNARTVSGLAAASCVTIYIDPDNKNKETEIIESDTLIAAPRYLYRFVCLDNVNEDVRVEVGGKFVWDQGLKEQVTHMIDSLKLPTK